LITAFVLSLIEIKRIRELSPSLADFVESYEYLSIFVTSILGPLLLSLLNFVLLPILLRFLTKFQGFSTKSGVERSVLRKYISFLLYQFLLLIGLGFGYTLVSNYFNPDDAKDENEKTLPLYIQLLQKMSDKQTFSSTTFIILASQGLSGFAVEIAQLVRILFLFFSFHSF
jgi:hypothetical protein